MKQRLALLLVIAALFGILPSCGIKNSDSNNHQKKEEQNIPEQEKQEKEHEDQEEVSSSSEDSMYQSAIKLHINNSYPTLEDMIPTYIEIIKSNDVIKNVKEKCPDAEFTLGAEQLNDSSIIQITVYSKTKEDLEAVMDHMVKEICEHIYSVVEGANCKVIDYGTIHTSKGEPKQEQNDFINNAAYKCTIKFYVNRYAISVDDFSLEISTSDIATSKSIIDTYKIIIQSDQVMNEVKVYCCSTLNTIGYCYSDIKELEEFAIRVEQIENTQIIAVTVYAENEVFTQTVANAIAKVVPEAIQNIVEGTLCNVVDSGIIEKNK